MFIVQRIVGGEGHLSVTHIARLGLLMPELVCDPEIEQVVAADTVLRDGRRQMGTKAEND